jgi:hypothetical protein
MYSNSEKQYSIYCSEGYHEMGRHTAHTGQKKNVYNVLVGEPEGKRPPGGPRRKWENNIKRILEK